MEKTLQIQLNEHRQKIANEILNFPVIFTEETTSEQRESMYKFLEYVSMYIRTKDE